MAVVSKLTTVLTAKTTAFQKSMRKSKGSVSGFRAAIAKASAGLKKMGIAAGAAAIGAAAGLSILVQKSMASIDTLAKTSDKLGLTTEALAGLRHAANMTGVGTSALDVGLQRMVRRVTEAAQGTGEAKDALRELGLDAKKLSKLTTDKQFFAIATAMDKVKTQGDKVRLTFKLFDTEGVNLVNTMRGGAPALEAFRKEAKAMGLTFSRDAAAGVEEANNAIIRAKAGFVGLGNTLAIALAPHIEKTAKAFSEWGKEAVKSGPAISMFVENFVEELSKSDGFLNSILKSMRELMGIDVGKNISEKNLRINEIDDELNAINRALEGGGWHFGEGKSRKELGAEKARLLIQVQSLKTLGRYDALRKQQKAEGTLPVDPNAGKPPKPKGLAELVDDPSDKLAKLQEKADSVFSATRTPLERYETKLGDLNSLVDEGAITWDTYSRAVDQAQKKLDDVTKKDNKLGDKLEDKAEKVDAGSGQEVGRFAKINTIQNPASQASRVGTIEQEMVRLLRSIAGNTQKGSTSQFAAA